MGPLRPGERDGARAQFGGELALYLPGAVAEAYGEPGHPLEVDDAVADHAHGTAYDIGAYVHSAEPGTASGRQRRQARKPDVWAAAAVG